MSTFASPVAHAKEHPVTVHVEPALTDRRRLTCAFRPVLAIPHLLLVGGPIALAFSLTWNDPHNRADSFSAGVLGAVAAVCAIIAWFALLLLGEYPRGLRDLALFYLRWRVRAVSYLMLLRDEYPPFGDGNYPAWLEAHPAHGERKLVSIAFRAILVIPHLFALWMLGVAWGITTLVAWCTILVTGSYPEALYDFSVGVLRWNVRVEAYLLLLHDEYPPFALH